MGLEAVSLLSTDPQVLEVTKQLESVAEEQLGPWSFRLRDVGCGPCTKNFPLPK